MNKKRAMWIVFILIVIAIFVWSFIYLRIVNKSPKYKIRKYTLSGAPITRLSVEDKELLKFVDFSLDKICEDYRFGNNKYIQGCTDTKEMKNKDGRIVGINIDTGLFIAKEYFAKGKDNIKNNLKANNEITKKIKELFLKAFSEREKSIDLIGEGLLKKDQFNRELNRNIYGKGEVSTKYEGEQEKGLAKIAIADSFYVNALEELKKLIDDLPATGWSLGEFDKKSKIFEVADKIGYYTDFSEADYDGYVYKLKKALENGDYYNAMINCSKALKIKPNDGWLNFCMGKIYHEQVWDDSTIEYYNKAIKAGYENPTIHIDLGFIFYRKAYYDDSSLEKKSNPDPVLLKRAMLNLRSGLLKFNENEDKGVVAWAHHHLGDIYCYKGQYREAINEFHHMIRVQSYTDLPHYQKVDDFILLGDTYTHIDKDEAYEYYEKAVEIAEKQIAEKEFFLPSELEKIDELKENIKNYREKKDKK